MRVATHEASFLYQTRTKRIPLVFPTPLTAFYTQPHGPPFGSALLGIQPGERATVVIGLKLQASSVMIRVLGERS